MANLCNERWEVEQLDPRIRGFRIDGVHSWYDKGIVIHDNPQISFPEKIKQEETIAGTNITYDVSSLISGIQPYGKRQIKLPINMLYQPDINIITTQMFAEHVFNWAYSGSGQKRLELDIIPYYYFLGEVVNSHEFTTNLLEIGYADIIFECYPFRIGVNPVGSKTFGEINIMSDWIQQTLVNLPKINQLKAQTIQVGDRVNIGPWALSSTIKMYHLHQTYTVKSINGVVVTFEEIPITTSSNNIVQAYEPTTFKLMNNGPANIIPEVMMYQSEGNSMNGGITIEMNGVYHTLLVSDKTSISTLAHNETFVLQPGLNEMNIYGSGYNLDFVFREERL